MPAINATASGSIGDDTYTGVVTNTVLSALRGLFAGQAAKPLKPTHIALGTGTRAPQPSDTALDAETRRWTITQLTQAGGTTTALLNLPASAGNVAASEMGVFAGDTLLSRAAVDIDKNNSSIINIIWVLSITQGG